MSQLSTPTKKKVPPPEFEINQIAKESRKKQSHMPKGDTKEVYMYTHLIISWTDSSKKLNMTFYHISTAFVKTLSLLKATRCAVDFYEETLNAFKTYVCNISKNSYCVYDQHLDVLFEVYLYNFIRVQLFIMDKNSCSPMVNMGLSNTFYFYKETFWLYSFPFKLALSNI